MMTPILGHQAVVRQLWSALERGTLHHAILLEGPRGVGKRLIAKRLAMAANCTKGTSTTLPLPKPNRRSSARTRRLR